MRCPKCTHFWKPTRVGKDDGIKIHILAEGEVHEGQLCWTCSGSIPIGSMCWADHDFPVLFCQSCVSQRPNINHERTLVSSQVVGAA